MDAVPLVSVVAGAAADGGEGFVIGEEAVRLLRRLPPQGTVVRARPARRAAPRMCPTGGSR